MYLPVRFLDDAESATLNTVGLAGPWTAVLDPAVRQGNPRHLRGRTVALDDSLARVLRLSPGDDAEFVLGDGTRVRLRVVMTYQRSLALGQALVPDDVLREHAAPPSRALVVPRPEAQTADVTGAVANLVRKRPGVAVDAASSTAPNRTVAPSAWVNLAGVAVILVFLTIGIVNATALATRTRRSELGLLRRVGLDRSTIVWMLCCEVAVTAALSVGLGVVVAAVPLAAMSVSFLGAAWPVGPTWVLPALALGVLTVVTVSVLLPAASILRDPLHSTGASA